MNPVWHVGGPVGGGVVGFGIEPFSERGLDEALGLAVGPWGVGPRRDVAGADGLEGSWRMRWTDWGRPNRVIRAFL